MLSALKGWWRLGMLLVCVLWVVGCSAVPAATVAPLPSPTPVVIVATPTSAPSATAAASATAVPDQPTDGPTSPPGTATPDAATATATPDPALAAIYNYLDARARADVEDVAALACQAWQSEARAEAVSFRSMQAKLDSIVCTANGSSGVYTLVGCTGKIITTYGTETREWDQSNFVYQAVPEDGAWKMCGYN